jgi:asparagine synthase (glutamine-hydrolysing)
MCGITGLYNHHDGRAKVARMTDALVHRGPDAGSVFDHFDERHSVALGHRRLSIIDLSAAADQPLQKGDWVLAFNGEIYNYRELAADLVAQGATFQTTSDTEVLLEAWAHWGADCLPRLRGMFAFALYHRPSGRLVLARDPFGIKPLFVARDGERLAFASELKALRPVLGPLRANDSALVASLLYVWVPETHCALEGAEKFPVGHYGVIEPGGPLQFTPYNTHADARSAPATEEPTLDDLRGVLEDSVAAHMVADVPVSTFLSGGLDSSLITVLAKRHAGTLDAYCIGFEDDDKAGEAMPDDMTYARKLAAQHDVRLHEIIMRADAVDHLPSMVDALDEPIGDAAAINTFLICKAARDAGVKVLLSGMGADEVFGGYRRHYACLLADRYRRLPSLVRRGLIEPLVAAAPVAVAGRGIRTTRWAKRFLDIATEDAGRAYQRSYSYFDESGLAEFLAPEMQRYVAPLFAEHAAVWSAGEAHDAVNRMCFTDLHMFLPGLNLTYSDRASMAASTEVRVPFVDTGVVDCAMAISGGRKVSGRTAKAVLKEAAEAWLPHEIIYRPKASFGLPLRSWVRGRLAPMVDELVGEAGLSERGIFAPGALRSMIDDDRAGRADHAQKIWHLLTTELWLQGVERDGQ